MFIGKGIGWGGVEVCIEVIGYGVVFFVQEMLGVYGDFFVGKCVGILGFGNVVIYVIQKVVQFGVIVVIVFDFFGYVVDDVGIDFDLLCQFKEVECVCIVEYVNCCLSVCFVEGGSVWEVFVDIVVLFVIQNEVSLVDVEVLIVNGVWVVFEGVNMFCVLEVVEVFQKVGVLFVLGKVVNVGGVVILVFEMSQNVLCQCWIFGDSENKFCEIMFDIYSVVFEVVECYGVFGDYVVGVNIVGFECVVVVMFVQGVI